MFLKAGLLIILILICLVGVVLTIIFTIIGFANNKPNKFNWLIAFFVFLIGIIICIYTLVNTMQTVAQESSLQMEQMLQNFSDTLIYSNDNLLQTNEHIKYLKSFESDSISLPNQFYTYLGFENYYRFPLRYPFSIHCSPFKDNGELYNEKEVLQFDVNDNGEVQTQIINISRLALDKNYLLLEQSVTSNHSNKMEKHYLLFSFITETKEEAVSEKELIKLAKGYGYKGASHLITIEEYSELFK